MEPWRKEVRCDELAHHGIKNMRWGFNKGQRNGKKKQSQIRMKNGELKMDNELKHYGTKGMRWGFNKGRRNGKKTAMDQLAETITGYGSTSESNSKAALGQWAKDTVARKKIGNVVSRRGHGLYNVDTQIKKAEKQKREGQKGAQARLDDLNKRKKRMWYTQLRDYKRYDSAEANEKLSRKKASKTVAKEFINGVFRGRDKSSLAKRKKKKKG